MSKTMGLAELLVFLIEREETSAKFFASVEARTSDSKLKEIFGTLKKSCLDRMASLKVMLSQEKDSSSRTYIPLASIREYLVDVKPRSEISDLQALALGGLRAETSEQLYARASALIHDPKIREIFEHLDGDQRLHKQLCNCLYDQRLERESSY
jgi:rubrerythrin